MSGTTDAEGKNTRGYDPLYDIRGYKMRSGFESRGTLRRDGGLLLGGILPPRLVLSRLYRISLVGMDRRLDLYRGR